MSSVILASDYRNEILENIHPGHVCGVNIEGNIQYSAGEPQHMTFLRSAFKPVQAIPAIKHDIQGYFGLTNRETALITASHRGEAFHIKELEQLLEKIGVPEEALLCHPAYPLNPGLKINW
ncbi:Asparaginase [Lentibacillus sp. JNUCC-1]|nr:Asparaginase [Lentibacillus sp. JNUCC-1]